MTSTATFFNVNNNNRSNTYNRQQQQQRHHQHQLQQQQQQLQQMTTISTAVIATATTSAAAAAGNSNNTTTSTVTTTTTTAAVASTFAKKFTTTKPAAKPKIIKSSSLDHEIFPRQQQQHQQLPSYQQLQQQQQSLHNRKIPASEWKRYNTIHSSGGGGVGGGIGLSGGGSMTRTGSTSSLASVATTTATTTNATAAAIIASANYQEMKMEIINQGKCLCSQYIRSRLRRAGVLNRKATQRLRTILEASSSTTTTSDAIIYEVFPALNSMGEELERMHPRIYTNVARQLSRAPFGELQDGDTAPMLLNVVAKDLFRNSITWGKIISIFAVCGGFAIDCVRQGHYDYLQHLIDGLTEIIEDDLAYWLAENGGWRGLQQHIRRPHDASFSFLGMLAMFVTLSSGVYVITNFAKHLGCHLYSLLF